MRRLPNVPLKDCCAVGFGLLCAVLATSLRAADATQDSAPSDAITEAKSLYDACQRVGSHFFVADICVYAEAKYRNQIAVSSDALSSSQFHQLLIAIKSELRNAGMNAVQVSEGRGSVRLKIPAYDSTILDNSKFSDKTREIAGRLRLNVSEGPDDYVIHATSIEDRNRRRQILVHTRDGNAFDLAKNPWLYTSEERSLVSVTVAELADKNLCVVPSNLLSRPKEPVRASTAVIPAASSACSYSFVFVRPTETPPPQLRIPKVFVGFMQVPQNQFLQTNSRDQEPLGLAVTNDLWHLIYEAPTDTPAEVRFTLNGMALKRIPKGHAADVPELNPGSDTAKVDAEPRGRYPPPFIIPPATDGWRVESFAHEAPMCRAFPTTPKPEFVDIPRPDPLLGLERANGIVVGAAKIFDVLALRKMLNDTANQLTSLVGFNAAAITGALSNFQGIARDTSFFNAQIATLPTNGISATNTNGSGGTGQTVSTALPIAPQNTFTTITLQCPDGTLPNITSGVQGCATTAGAAASTTTVTNNSTLTPATTSQTTTGTNNAQQNSTVSTTPSITGQSFIPAAAQSTALTPPTNIGLSSADILTDQVNLNAQLTTLRLLLQGALSDQYLVKGGKAVASRQQTTIGFTVSLDPPRQYKHAVAEVRIVVSAPAGEEGISVMNLLPSEKTYNVAKVTSSEKSFGAGVIKSPIGLGINTGRSRDRLYLAKDTDTLALLYPSPDSRGIGRTVPVAVADFAGSAAHLDWRVEGCDDDQTSSLPPQGRIDEGETTSVVFGWQFRPVLGETYVKGGQRQVFAQLALPASQNQRYVPRVHIQTRWRAYDPKRQAVGATYQRTCSWSEDDSGVVVLTNPSVDDVKVRDIGGGQVRLTAWGEFFSSGATIVAGTSTYLPSAFDGRSVQFIGRAADLMQSDELTIVGPNGQYGVFGIPVAEGKVDRCRIDAATATAIPYPDGNSRVNLKMTLGSDYTYNPGANPELPSDGKPNPFILIGSQVYGLRETPFGLDGSSVGPADPRDRNCTRDRADTVTCQYSFIAPTTDIRNAQTFLVRDLAWNDMRYTGPIRFLPSVTELARITPAKDADSDSTIAPPPAGDTLHKPDGAPKATGASVKAAPDEKKTPVKAPSPAGATHRVAKTAGPVDFSVKGYDLQKAIQCPRKAGTKTLGSKNAVLPSDPTWLTVDSSVPPEEQLCVFVAGGDFEWRVVSPTVATLRVSAQLAQGPTLRLQLMSLTTQNDWTRHIVWDLPIPKDSTDSGGIATIQMHRGDGGLITFKGTSFKSTPTVTFDGTPLDVYVDPSKKTQVGVFIPSTLTKIGGHKELKATVSGSTKVTMLPIDVLN